MADGKIYITISDKRGEGSNTSNLSANSSSARAKSKTSDEKNLFLDYAKYELFNFVKSQAQTLVNYTMGNIGNFTGNYQVQRNISDGMKISNMVKSVAMASIAGSQYGPGGAVIGAAIAAGSIVTNTYLEARTYQIEINKQNNAIRENRKLTGLDALTNSSRSGS